MWTEQCIAAAGLFSAAGNCSTCPTKLTVKAARDVCKLQLCKVVCEGKGGTGKVAWMDGWMGKGVAHVPGSS